MTRSFGGVSGSRETAHLADGSVPATPIVRAWHLDRVSDREGNYYTVGYLRRETWSLGEHGPEDSFDELAPERIEYTGHDIAGPPTRFVDMLYATGARANRAPRYIAGVREWPALRLDTVRITVGQTMVFEYQLTYQQSGATAREMLSELRHCAYTPILTCKPPTVFEWDTGPAIAQGLQPTFLERDYLRETYEQPFGHIAGDEEVDGHHYLKADSTLVLDANGDGVDDLLVVDDGVFYLRPGHRDVSLSMGTALNYGLAPLHAATSEMHPVDYNQDGRDDVLLVLIQPASGASPTFPDGGYYKFVVYESPADPAVGFTEVDLGLESPGAPGTEVFYEWVAMVRNDIFEEGYFPQLISGMHELLDFDGDGRRDIVVCEIAPTCTAAEEYATGMSTRPPGGNVKVCPSRLLASFGTDGGFAPFVDTGVPVNCFVEAHPHVGSGGMFGRPLGVGDFDGDGRQDVLTSFHSDDAAEDVTGTYRFVRWSPGGGFEAVDTSLSTTVPYTPTTFLGRGAVQVVDVNSDGLSDVLTYEYQDSQWLSRVHLNRGDIRATDVAVGTQGRAPLKNYFLAAPLRTGPSMVTNFFAETSTQMVWSMNGWTQLPEFGTVLDLNVDGYADWVQPGWDAPDFILHESGSVVYAVDGHLSATYGGGPGGAPNYGDRATGLTIEGPKGWSGDAGGGINAFEGVGFDVKIVVADVDGDGVQDLIEYDYMTQRWADTVTGTGFSDGATFRDIPRLRVHRNTQGRFERLTDVTDGLGSQLSFEYAPLTDPAVYTPGTTCLASQRCVTDPRYVISRVFADDGARGLREQRHTYVDGRDATNGRGWLGFAEHHVTDISTGGVVSTHFDNVTYDAATGDYPFAHQPSRVDTYLGSDVMDPFGQGSIVFAGTRTTNCLSLRTTPENTHWVANTCRNVEVFESTAQPTSLPFGGLSPERSIHETIQYDAYGNVEGTTVSRGGAYVEQLTRPFAIDVPNWLLRLPASEQYSANSTGCVIDRTTTFGYATDGSGRLITSTAEPGAPEQVATSFTHDLYGNVLTRTQTPTIGVARVLTHAWEPEGYFISQETNALGHVRSIVVHSALGTPVSVSDANGNVTVYEYDGFGRPTRLTNADGTTQATNYFIVAEADGVSSYSYGTAARDTFAYIDTRGRAVTAGVALADGRWSVRTATYDGRGLMTTQTEPHFWGTAPTGTRTFQYDALNLTRQVDGPEPGVSERFWVHSSTYHSMDARGAVRARSVDDAGFIATSTDPAPGGTTTYEHCVDGTVTRATDPQGNVLLRSIDSLGRVQWADDPDTGMSWYTYTSFGELATADNAEGELTQFDYDVLGRPAQRTSADGTDIYRYDGPNGIGLPYYSYRGRNGSYVYHQYDTLARETTRWHAVDGVWRAARFVYDAQSRVERVTYPSAHLGSFSVTRSYDTQGGLTAIHRDDTGALIWSLVEDAGLQRLSPRLQIEEETFGNGRTTERGYVSGTGQIERIQTTGWAFLTFVTYQDLELAYDGAGDLQTRTDHKYGELAEFEYDTMGQLTEYRREGVLRRSYQYDSLGNMIAASDVGAMTHGMAPGSHPAGNRRLPHAVTQSSAGSFLYDNVGRLTLDPSGRTVEWLANGLPRRIVSGTAIQQMDYDALDRRIGKTVNGERTVYLENLYELRTDGAGSEEIMHIQGPDREVAYLRVDAPSSAIMYYVHDDEMGSPNVVTQSGFTPIRYAYEPFGARRTETWTTTDPLAGPGPRQGYTGHEHDDAVGLINMRGRLYDPVSRHFISPDPVIANHHDTVSYNAYGYVRNNPFRFTDPTGLTGEAVGGAGPSIERPQPPTRLGESAPDRSGCAAPGCFNYPSGPSTVEAASADSGVENRPTPQIPPRRGGDVSAGSDAATITDRIEWSRNRARRSLRQAMDILDEGMTTDQRAVFRRWFPGANSTDIREIRSLLRENHRVLQRVPIRFITLGSPAADASIDPLAVSHIVLISDGTTPARTIGFDSGGTTPLPERDRWIALYPRWALEPGYGATRVLHEGFHVVDPSGMGHGRGHTIRDPFRLQGFVSQLTGLGFNDRHVRRQAGFVP